MRRKVFDWVTRFGIIAFVVCIGAAWGLGQERPTTTGNAPKGKVVTEEEASEFEGDDGVVEVIIKLPKPEAMIFSNRMNTRYQEIGYEQSFLDKIEEAAKHSPF